MNYPKLSDIDGLQGKKSHWSGLYMYSNHVTILTDMSNFISSASDRK